MHFVFLTSIMKISEHTQRRKIQEINLFRPVPLPRLQQPSFISLYPPPFFFRIPTVPLFFLLEYLKANPRHILFDPYISIHLRKEKLRTLKMFLQSYKCNRGL